MEFEEAPTYRDDGAMRILFGLSVVDLVVIAGIFIVLLKVLPVGGLLNLTLSAGTAWFGGQVISKSRAQIPFEAIKQYVLWLGQPDVFEPGVDTDARMLVFEIDQEEEA